MTRAYGTGSLYPVGDRWVFARSFWDDGKRVRRTVVGKTPEEALARGEARTNWGPNMERRARREAAAREALRLARRDLHAGDHETGRERKDRARLYAAKVIGMGIAEGWSLGHIAEVVIATLTPNRVRRSIYGPCVYCGSWLATEVDHIVPTVRGGTDDPSNLASACKPCNTQKHARTPEEWSAA